MPTLIEANVFARLLSLFYRKKDAGKSDDIKNFLDKTTDNPAFDRVYNEWEKSSEDLLLATKRMLQRSGGDTSKIDALLKKYHNY